MATFHSISLPPAPTHDLGSPLLRSAALHAAFILSLWAAFGVQERKIEAQETRVREDLERKQAELEAEREQLQQDVAKATSIEEIRMMLTSLVHDTVPEADLAALLAELETSLEELFAQQENMDWTAADAEAMADLQRQALDGLQQQQQDLLARALVERMRSYVREELVPELRAEVENRLKEQVGKHIDRKASQALQQATRQGSLDSTEQRAAAAATSDALDAHVASAAEKAVAEELVPKASERVMSAFDKDIETLKINREQLGELVSEDIRKALKEELSATNPASNPATTAFDHRNALRDLEALTKSQQEVAAASQKLAQLADQQRKIREEPPTEAIDKQPAQQEQVAAVAEAYAEARTTIDAANRIAASDRTLSEARKQTKEAKGHSEAKKADKQLRNGLMEDATTAMEASEARLREAATAMAAAAQTLSEQVAAAAAQEALPTTTSPAAMAAAEAATAASAETAAAETGKAVAGAAQQVRIAGVLTGDERIKQLIELGNKLAAASAQMGEGRSLGAPSLLPGAGLMGGGGGNGMGRALGLMGGRMQMNRAAYEAFVKDLQNRINPENAYGDIAITEGIGTRHAREPETVAEQALISDSQQEHIQQLRDAVKDAPERTVAEPDFPTPAWGGAPMLDVPLTIDGDLSDWGDLTHPLRLRWKSQDGENQYDSGIDVHLRWSSKGLFAAYRVGETDSIQLPTAGSPWNGDSFEWWLDLDNSRRDDSGKSETAHQFLLAPFGIVGAAEKRCFEYTHGQRQQRAGVHDLNHVGFSAAKIDSSGYSVEVFLQRAALAKPILLPGQILAMNMSVNLGLHSTSQTWQWSSSKAIGTFMKPDTWGDVVLLGADAKLRFTAITERETTLEFILPGQPLGLEIQDADMNIRDDLRDRVAASIGAEESSDRLFVVLDETGPDTGIFRASVDTAAFLAEADSHTVVARPGNILTLTYQDPRAAYGEQNREVKAWLPVAYPMQRLGGSSAPAKEP